jgi:hypothetical protein
VGSAQGCPSRAVRVMSAMGTSAAAACGGLSAAELGANAGAASAVMSAQSCAAGASDLGTADLSDQRAQGRHNTPE